VAQISDKYWKGLLGRYKVFLKLERSLSPASVEAYLHDINKFLDYLLAGKKELRAGDIGLEVLESFLKEMNEAGIGLRTQARLISGLRSFFTFLVLEKEIAVSPATLLEIPRTGRHLPEVLSVEEIDRIEAEIDMSRPAGHRNRAILEVMYGCGMRVSEVINLRISHIFRDEGFVRILGKGSKERLVPINDKALGEIDLYLIDRNQMEIDPAYSDILFLNHRGRGLSRVYIFKMVRELARKAGIEGQVIVRVLVGKDGKPKKAVVQYTDSKMLDKAAVKAVMKQVFTPAIQNGRAITCWVSIPIKFKLR